MRSGLDVWYEWEYGRKYDSVGFIFFFQAEDGIRDYKVTGVQTCALPILAQPAILRREDVIIL